MVSARSQGQEYDSGKDLVRFVKHLSCNMSIMRVVRMPWGVLCEGSEKPGIGANAVN